MKKTLSIFSSLLTLWFLYSKMVNQSAPITTNAPKLAQPQRSISSVGTGLEVAIEQEDIVSKDSKIEPSESKQIDEIFQTKYLNDPDAQRLEQELEKIFSGTKNQKVISRWVIMGLYLANDNDFNRVMKHTLEKLKENSRGVLDDILQREPFIKDSPFTEQLVLSMVSLLDVSAQEKAEYFSQVITRELWIEGSEPSDSSLNINTALAFLSQENLSRQELEDIFLTAIAQNEDNPQALEEMMNRILNFYPDLQN